MTLYKLPSTTTITRRNRHTNPDLTENISGWGASPSTAMTFNRVNDSAVGGYGFALRVSDIPAGGAVGFNLGPSFDITAGTIVTVSCYARREAGTAPLFSPRIEWSDNTVSVAPATTITSTTEYVRVSVSATAPAGVTSAVLRAYVTGATATTVLRFRRALCEFNTTTVRDYFDGSFDSTVAVQYEWVGTAGASQSIIRVPDSSSTLEPVMTLAPYTARREAGTVVHRLLDDSQARFTWRQPNLPVGVFEFLFDGHAAAYAALNKLSARTAWALYDEADDGPIERWFMIADGDIEMEQDEDLQWAYIVRVPYVEVDSI